MRETIVYDREKLYEQVWQRPMREVCKDYGISDVALAKICKKLKVPRPEQGHWIRAELGKASSRPPLPPLKAGERTHIHVGRRRPERLDYGELEEHPDVSPDVRAFIDRARDLGAIHVPARVTRLHRFLTSEVKRAPVGHGWREETLRLTASKAVEVRYRRLTHVILATLEQCGATLVAGQDPHLGFVEVRVGRGKLRFRLRETFRIERTERPGWSGKMEQRTDQVPSGKLELNIESFWDPSPPQKTWRESEATKIEDVLGDIVVGIGLALATNEMWEAQHERRRRGGAVEAERRARIARLAEVERELERDLERRGDRLVVADKLRGFLKDPRVRALAAKAPTWAAWLTWAEGRALALEESALTSDLPADAKLFFGLEAPARAEVPDQR